MTAVTVSGKRAAVLFVEDGEQLKSIAHKSGGIPDWVEIVEVSRGLRGAFEVEYGVRPPALASEDSVVWGDDEVASHLKAWMQPGVTAR